MKQLFVLLLAVAISACSKETKIPKSVLQPEEFAAVITDLHLAESTATEKGFSPEEANEWLKKEYATIFGIHDITPAEFEESLRFYLEHPNFMNEVYLNAIEAIGTKEEQMVHQ